MQFSRSGGALADGRLSQTGHSCNLRNSDELTIRQCRPARAGRGGRADAFSAFYREHLDVVLAFFRRRVSDRELAFDLTAETFAAVVVGAGTYAGEAPPVAWLFGIARNKLRESLRRDRVQEAARHRLGLEPILLDNVDLERVEDPCESWRDPSCSEARRASRPDARSSPGSPGRGARLPACQRAEGGSERPTLTDAAPLKAITDLLPALDTPVSASDQEHTLAALIRARDRGLLLARTLRTIPVAPRI